MMMPVTKSYTAMLVLRAIEHGWLQLDIRISEMLPEFSQCNKNAINVYHVLTHQAGIYGLPLPPAPLEPGDIGDLDKMFEGVSSLPTDFSARTKSSYSSFAVLGKLLEATDPHHRRFTQIAQQEIFPPLGMTDSRIGGTSSNPRRVPVSHTIRMMQADSTMASSTVVEHFLNSMANTGCQVPSVNVYGTADDLFRFAETLRRGGVYGKYRLTSPSMLRYATKNHCADMPNEIFKSQCEHMNMPHLRANFGLHGEYVRDEDHHLDVAGCTSSSRSFSGMGGGQLCGLWTLSATLRPFF